MPVPDAMPELNLENDTTKASRVPGVIGQLSPDAFTTLPRLILTRY